MRLATTLGCASCPAAARCPRRSCRRTRRSRDRCRSEASPGRAAPAGAARPAGSARTARPTRRTALPPGPRRRRVELVLGLSQLHQVDRLDLGADPAAQPGDVKRRRVKAHVVRAHHAQPRGLQLPPGARGAGHRDHAGRVHRRVGRVEQVVEAHAEPLQRVAQPGRAGSGGGGDEDVSLRAAAVAVEQGRALAESEGDPRRRPHVDPVDHVQDQQIPVGGRQLGDRKVDVDPDASPGRCAPA